VDLAAGGLHLVDAGVQTAPIIAGYGEDGPYRKQKAQNGVRAKAGFWRCTKGPRAMRAWGYRPVTSPQARRPFKRRCRP
jgi:hypothetical protein